jgi:hypothetical protein
MKIVSPETLMERVTKARSGCWIWEGARSKEGYGVLRLDDGQRQAPRLFWETFMGPVPDGYPVHFLPLDAHSQCVKRLMRAAPRSEPVGEALEIDLINLVEDRHHSLLDDLVFQRCDAQRALPSVGLRYIDSP